MAILVSDPSAVVTTSLQVEDWWIKDPKQILPDLLIHVEGDGDGLKRNRVQQAARFNPIGRNYPVIVADKVKGYNGSLDIAFNNDEAGFEKLKAIFDSQRVMLLQSGWLREQMYVRFMDDWREQVYNTTPPYRVITVEYVEQERPA